MKIAVFGIIPFSDLIKEGFQKLGHEISNNNPDLIFANDPIGYQDATFLKAQYPNVHLILNVLDIPWHFGNIEKQFEIAVKRFFNKAEYITTISYKVKKDLAKFLDKKIEVIYNPIKDVFYDESIKKNNTFLYVGRANDPVKRTNLLKQAFSKTVNGIIDIKICGSEDPGFGTYLNVVSDQELNKLYNSSKYLLLPSKAEGLGLTMIEAMICGSLPIACSDNETAKEFLPKDFICEPNAQSILDKIEELNKEYDAKRKLALEYGKKYKIQFDKMSIAKKILGIFNPR